MDCNKITSRLTLIRKLTLQAIAALGNGNSTLSGGDAASD